MSLVVEDGSGVSNAESYVSVADADTHLANVGLTNWATITDPEKEAALRRATQYIEQAYRQRWQGLPRYPRSAITPGEKIQALSWPRFGVYIDYYPVSPDSVPPEVANACAELAFKAAAGDLNADLSTRIISESVGPISTEYDAFSPQRVRYPSIDMMLAPLLVSGGANAKLMRA